MKPCFSRFCTTVYTEPQLILMDWSLPRCRRVAAISYGYIGRSVSNVSSDSASRLLIFRRLAIVPHLVSESSLTRTRSQVLVDEYRHREASSAIGQIKDL